METLANVSKEITIRKSDLSKLAQWAKGNIEEEVINGNIEVTVILGEIEINLSQDFVNANVINAMSYFRRRVSNILFLKGLKMYVKISINGEVIQNNLFTSKLVYAGKKEARYLVFNQFFIVTLANYFGSECVITDDLV